MRKLTLEEIGQKRLDESTLKSVDRFPVSVILDNIRSLYNVGSIFRTADAARVEKLYLTGITGSPPRKEIDKTALGAVETVPYEYHRKAMDVILDFRCRGIPVFALEHTDESRSLWTYKVPFPCALIIGHEVSGVQEELLQQVDGALEIPMFGAKHSLNAAVAFGVAIYHLVHQYLQTGDV